MDGIFGHAGFRCEVIWKRQSSHNSAKRWGPVHDCILHYSGRKPVWNRVLQPFDSDCIVRHYRNSDERGKFMVDNLTGSGRRDGDTGKPWRDIDPSEKGRHRAVPHSHAVPEWAILPDAYPQMTARQRLDVLDRLGLIHWPTKGSMPRFKRYLTPSSGAPLTDIVTDIPPLSASAKEKTGYPTQKPLALLDRIIRASSNEGDMVFDRFCGRATALVATDRLQRQWAGIDLSPLSGSSMNGQQGIEDCGAERRRWTRCRNGRIWATFRTIGRTGTAFMESRKAFAKVATRTFRFASWRLTTHCQSRVAAAITRTIFSCCVPVATEARAEGQWPNGRQRCSVSQRRVRNTAAQGQMTRRLIATRCG